MDQVTGVAVRETVPDRLLDDADEVEFVDLPAEDLLRRLAEGKVYLPEQAARAAERLLPQGQPDRAARAGAAAHRRARGRRRAATTAATTRSRTTWPVAERILVCVRPEPAERPPRARGAAHGRAAAGAEWIVVSVESPAQPPLSAAERAALAATSQLAEQLGAETATSVRRRA